MLTRNGGGQSGILSRVGVVQWLLTYPPHTPTHGTFLIIRESQYTKFSRIFK